MQKPNTVGIPHPHWEPNHPWYTIGRHINIQHADMPTEFMRESANHFFPVFLSFLASMTDITTQTRQSAATTDPAMADVDRSAPKASELIAYPEKKPAVSAEPPLMASLISIITYGEIFVFCT